MIKEGLNFSISKLNTNQIFDYHITKLKYLNYFSQLLSVWQNLSNELTLTNIYDIFYSNKSNSGRMGLPLSFLCQRSLCNNHNLNKGEVDQFGEKQLRNQREATTTYLPDLYKHLSPKNVHEVDILSRVINEIYKNHKEIGHVVDVGSGQGHLTRHLAVNYHIPVTCIEGLKDNSEKAVLYDVNLRNNNDNQKNIENICLPIHKAVYLERSISTKEWNEIVGDGDTREYTNYLINALHSCGELAPTMIELFCKVENCKVLVLTSRCYRKMNQNSLTMSEIGIRVAKNTNFTYIVLESACHFAHHYEEKLRLSHDCNKEFESQIFRTVLNFQCEDVMFDLILRYLIPCTHLFAMFCKFITRLTNVTVKSWLLTESYKCTTIWNKRLDNVPSSFSANDLNFKLQASLNNNIPISALDFDIYVNKIDEVDRTNLEFVHTLVKSFRKTQESLKFFESSSHAIIRNIVQLDVPEQAFDSMYFTQKVGKYVFVDNIRECADTRQFLQHERIAGLSTTNIELGMTTLKIPLESSHDIENKSGDSSCDDEVSEAVIKQKQVGISFFCFPHETGAPSPYGINNIDHIMSAHLASPKALVELPKDVFKLFFKFKFHFFQVNINNHDSVLNLKYKISQKIKIPKFYFKI